MWTGGRSHRSIAVAGGVLASLGTAAGQAPLCNGQHPGNPELIAGAASCVYNEVGGIGQTVIDLSDTSIIRWDHFGLGTAGSSLTFRWSGGPNGNPTVLNEVVSGNAGRNDTDLHLVAGSLNFAGGNLIVTNPNSAVEITGTVAARSLIFATHKLAPGMEEGLLNGEGAEFVGAHRDLVVADGSIVTTGGDLILAGRNVHNRARSLPETQAPELVAGNGSVRLFGGENFRLLPGGRERLEALPGSPQGSVSSSKGIRASQDVEIAATAAIANSARITANNGGGRVYLRVSDPGGKIINEAGGFINGFIIPSQQVSNSGRIEGDGDSPSPLSTGISRFRIPPKPGSSDTPGKTVVRFENAPTAGSASAQRDRSDAGAGAARRTARSEMASNAGAPLARASSFFGMRGGAGAQRGAQNKKSR